MLVRKGASMVVQEWNGTSKSGYGEGVEVLQGRDASVEVKEKDGAR